MSRSSPLVWIAALGAALRVGLALRPVQVLDDLFVPDDTYYTLGIARNLARGLGPTFDGQVLTNGFQPLLALFELPLVAWLPGLDGPVVGVILFGALLGGLEVWLLGRVAERAAGRVAGVATAALWALSPTAIANDLCGLETALALVCVLGLVERWSVAEGRGRVSDWAVAGALAGLCLLARVDTVFVVGMLGVSGLWRALRGGGGLRGLGIAIATAAAVVAPWWGWCTWRLGSPVPQSGAAVRLQAGLHPVVAESPLAGIGWATGTLVGRPLGDLPALREALVADPLFGLLFSGLVAGVGAGVAGVVWRRCGRSGPLAALLLHGGVLAVFYALYVPVLWFFSRYLHPSSAVLCLLAGLSFGLAWRAGRGRVLLLGLAAGLLLVEGVGTARLFAVQPAGSVHAGMHGAKGYRRAALEVLALVPEGGTVGGFQAGAIGWYGDGRVAVVNLDGVVDAQAAQALEAGAIGAYARDRGVDHLVDWDVNLEAILRLGGPALDDAERETVGRASPQGFDRMRVVEVRWR